MPTRNAGSYLQTAVSSILCQTFKNLELIIVDDHSQDDSLTQLDKQDKRVNIIKNSGTGIVCALNTGIEKAKYPLIARMDADDIALPARLQKQFDYLALNPQIQICSTQVELFRHPEQIGGGYQVYQQWINQLTHSDAIANSLFIESPIPHPTVLMKKQDIIDLGGYRDHGWPEDYDLWLRAHLRGYKFGKPEGVLLRWRDHDTRLSRRSTCYAKKAFFKAKVYYLTQLFATRQFRIWGSGPTGALLHDEIINNNGIVVDFIDVAPKRIGNTKRGKPIVDAYKLEKTNDLILLAVSARGARDDIKHFLIQRGFTEKLDYVCAA